MYQNFFYSCGNIHKRKKNFFLQLLLHRFKFIFVTVVFFGLYAFLQSIIHFAIKSVNDKREAKYVCDKIIDMNVRKRLKFVMGKNHDGTGHRRVVRGRHGR